MPYPLTPCVPATPLLYGTDTHSLPFTTVSTAALAKPNETTNTKAADQLKLFIRHRARLTQCKNREAGRARGPEEHQHWGQRRTETHEAAAPRKETQCSGCCVRSNACLLGILVAHSLICTNKTIERQGGRGQTAGHTGNLIASPDTSSPEPGCSYTLLPIGGSIGL
ncbi:hypothetical protein XELAEV_18030724mg [Xenopus laevis]|uniref:Uncharacterized protein n=1 Tax=Xenopus laevis TaxID=8355 RepID=A0A974HF24_XENLA|nr:hypothetical protein XELAEV_18030724mg [Xenopus laevis]